MFMTLVRAMKHTEHFEGDNPAIACLRELPHARESMCRQYLVKSREPRPVMKSQVRFCPVEAGV